MKNISICPKIPHQLSCNKFHHSMKIMICCPQVTSLIFKIIHCIMEVHPRFLKIQKFGYSASFSAKIHLSNFSSAGVTEMCQLTNKSNEQKMIVNLFYGSGYRYISHDMVWIKHLSFLLQRHQCCSVSDAFNVELNGKLSNFVNRITRAHLGGLFGCHDRPLCTAGIQH